MRLPETPVATAARRLPLPSLELLLGGAVTAVTAALCIAVGPKLWHQDASHYLSLGEHLARGQGYTSSVNLFHDLLQPPLYPLLIAAGINLGASAYASAVAVCVLSAVAAFVAVVKTHEALWGAGARSRRFAVAAAAISPALALDAGLTLEPLFLALLASALYFAVTALLWHSVPRAAGCGLLLGLALLARSEVVITAPILGALVLVWRAPWRRRAIAAVALAGAAAAVVVPYGLWTRSRLGFFDVLPKVRYNVLLADISEHMAWTPAQEEPAISREERVLLALMPDHRTFILNHAFAHPDFDPRPLFPRRAEKNDGGGLVGAGRVVVSTGVQVGLFQPLAALLMLLGAWAGVRRGAARDTRFVTLALVALVGAHLLPALVSGDDFQDRYLAASILFSLPLVAAGAQALADRLARFRFADAAIVAVLAGSYAVVALRNGPHQPGSAVNQARWRAVDRAVEELIPRGARLLSEHPRSAILHGGEAFSLPCVDTREELEAYVAAHDIQYAILDGRALLKNPSEVDRGLIDPKNWPAGWRPLGALFQDGPKPIWIVALR